MAGCVCTTFVARLTKDPELRYTNAGAACCTLALAASETYNDNGQKKEKTVFFDAVCYNKYAEACNRYLSKGSMIFGNGKLEMSLWNDKTSGKQRKSLFIKIEHIEFLKSKNESEQQQNQSQSQQNAHIYSQEDAQAPASSYAQNDVPF